MVSRHGSQSRKTGSDPPYEYPTTEDLDSIQSGVDKNSDDILDLNEQIIDLASSLLAVDNKIVPANKIWEYAHKPGALYISYSSTSPASLFGGTWLQITGRFLRAHSDVNTGGSDTVNVQHSHGLGNGYAAFESYATHEEYKYKTIPSNVTSWVSNYKVTNHGSGGASGNSATHATAMALGGTTDNAGSTTLNNMPAYQNVYVWRRVS